MLNPETDKIKSTLSWEKITTYYNIPYKEGQNVCCPFHDDKTASLSFHKDQPTFNCFGCEAQGDYFNFIALKENLDCISEFPEVLRQAELIAGTNYLEKKNSQPKSSSYESKALSSKIVQRNFSQLAANQQVLDWFKNERKINLETLQKAKVGFAAHPQMKGKAVIHFPYQDNTGQPLFNRIREVGAGKNVMSEKGAKAQFYLKPNSKTSNRLFITEGEIDALTILQHCDEVIGVPGSQAFSEQMAHDLKHLSEVVFCGDNDAAGRAFNEKAIKFLKQNSPQIKTSYINWEGFDEKHDVNDFYRSLENPNILIAELEKLAVEKSIKKVSPLQYFDEDFACTTIFEDVIIDDKKEGKKLIQRPFLITAERQKIPLRNVLLYEKLLITERYPSPHDLWSKNSFEKFLRNVNREDSLQATFSKIRNELRLYLLFEEERFYDLIPLWIIATYFHRGMATFPYIAINGDKSCGKSKLLSFIASLSFQGLVNIGGTAASTIRLIHNNHVTCCADEAENLSNSRDENAQALLGIYNSGYKKGAFVSKCGINNEVERFDSYSPKAFAGIRPLNDTTKSRCISVQMLPVKNREKFNREINLSDSTFTEIRDQLYIHLLSDFKDVLKAYQSIESPHMNLNGRDWEIWKPILTLAQLIDLDLFKSMTDFALNLTEQRKSQDFSAEDTIEFLKVFLKQLEDNPDLKNFVPVSAIREALVSTEIDTFVELADESQSNRWIGARLKRLGLLNKPAVQKKIGTFNTRCYKINKQALEQRLEALQR